MSKNKLAGKISEEQGMKRENFVGVSLDKSRRQQIEKRAHELWVAGGCAHGNDIDHWLSSRT
jgi:Protein of unknown function (DUF2934)